MCLETIFKDVSEICPEFNPKGCLQAALEQFPENDR